MLSTEQGDSCNKLRVCQLFLYDYVAYLALIFQSFRMCINFLYGQEPVMHLK